VALGQAIATYRAIETSDSFIVAARALGASFGD
jgi:hypothetical protein